MDGRVEDARPTEDQDEVRRWLTQFDRLPLFTHPELEPTPILRPRPRPHPPAQHLVRSGRGTAARARARRSSRSFRNPGCSSMPRRPITSTHRRDASQPSPVRSRRRQPAPRRPFRDNPRLILAGIGCSSRALAALLALANRSPRFSPDFLTEFVLYALSVADLTMLVALVFVLARNIIKLIVERRRALPFARFRAKLVALLLGMTLIPAVLVLIVGSELIRNERRSLVQRADGRVLPSANADCERLLPRAPGAGHRPRRSASRGAARRARSGDRAMSRPCAIARPRGDARSGVQMVEVYRVPAAAIAPRLARRWSTSPRRACRRATRARRPIGWRRAPPPAATDHASARAARAAASCMRAAALVRARRRAARPASWWPATT